MKPLIWIESVIERHVHSRVEYMIKAKSQFKRRSTANNVEVVIPVPADADSPKFKTTVGSVKYAPEQNAITWTIKSFPVTSLDIGFKLSLTFAINKLNGVNLTYDINELRQLVRQQQKTFRKAMVNIFRLS